MSIVNPAEKMQVTIAYDPATLPVLNHWKQMGEGEYVIGMEPGNCTPTGQSDNKKSGMLKMIEPGEVVEFNLQIEVTEL